MFQEERKVRSILNGKSISIDLIITALYQIIAHKMCHKTLG
jgi:hypothetical protein